MDGAPFSVSRVRSSVSVDGATSWAGSLANVHLVSLCDEARCARVIAEAEASGEFGLRGEYEGTTTLDIDVMRVDSLWAWLSRAASEEWLPLLTELYGVHAILQHLRVVKYVAGAARATGIGLHSDGSELSFVCTLNDGFTGGGTYVRALGRVLAPPRGEALFFCGRWVHAGVTVTTGVRYVLTGFFALRVPHPPWSESGQYSSSATSELASAVGPDEAADAYDDDDDPNDRAASIVATSDSAGVPSSIATVECNAAAIGTASLIRASEERASVLARHCPLHRHWLRRAFSPGGSGESTAACTRCGESAPYGSVLHCCTAGASDDDHTYMSVHSPHHVRCATAWCDACLRAEQTREARDRSASLSHSMSSASVGHDDRNGDSGSGGSSDQSGADSSNGTNDDGIPGGMYAYSPEMECAFVADVTLPDGACVPMGSVQRKVWRLRAPDAWQSTDAERGDGDHSRRRLPRIWLVRDDVDSDERMGSRCLGADAILWRRESVATQTENEVTLDVATELHIPRATGPFRVFFRLVYSYGDGDVCDGPARGEAPTIEGDAPPQVGAPVPFGDRLWVDVYSVELGMAASEADSSVTQGAGPQGRAAPITANACAFDDEPWGGRPHSPSYSERLSLAGARMANGDTGAAMIQYCTVLRALCSGACIASTMATASGRAVSTSTVDAERGTTLSQSPSVQALASTARDESDENEDAIFVAASLSFARCLAQLQAPLSALDARQILVDAQPTQVPLRELQTGLIYLLHALSAAPWDMRLHDALHRTRKLRDPPVELPGGVDACLHRAALAQRLRRGAALSRSWCLKAEEESARARHVHAPTGGTLVLAFAGADALIGGEPFPGGLPSHEFASALRRAGVHAAIFVRDVLRAWYLRGIDTTGHSFEAVVAQLRKEVDACRPARLVTLGCSMGGYAALRAGLMLRADVALAFAPQVVLQSSERAALGLPEAPYDRLLHGVEALGRLEGFALPSLVEVLRDAPVAADGAHATTLEMHTGMESPGDVAEAAMLERAIAQRPELRVRCTTTAHPAVGHGVAAALRQSGLLHGVLSRVCHAPSPATNIEPLQDGHCDAVHGALDAGGPRMTSPRTSLPRGFVGFENCPDF